ncbi:MAG: DNA recombination protein RmuC [Patescibacteria group bacterium]|nr:DNA recombination protein RmuC [Patescibacteria group bacterium]
MEYLIISLLIIVITGLGSVFYLLFKKKPEKHDSDSLLMLQQQMNQLSQVLDTKLSQSAESAQKQFNQSSKIIRDVTEKLTKLDETNKQVVGFAEQLQSLENILTNPKQRGILGEYYLETVLKNVLPPGSYKIQYPFKDGTIVDAVVFYDKQIIPIDSKFSLENYNRILDSQIPEEKKKHEIAFINDLKFRIDETSKYVKPEEKTIDFAFMFIPSEAIYYDLLINKVGVVTGDTNSLISYAVKKKVVIVSPTSFLAYLQTVLQGLRRQKISEQALWIIKEVERLGKHLGTYSQYMEKIGNHLTTTVSSYNKANKELKKIDKDVVKITDGQPQIKIKEIEKPSSD